MLHVVRAFDHRPFWADNPELHLIVDDDDPAFHKWPEDKRQSNFMAWALANLTFEVIEERDGLWVVRGMGEDRLIAHQREIRPKADGKYTLKTNRGEVRYDYFGWSYHQPKGVPYDQWMIAGNYRFPNSGMIQFGMLNLKALLEAAEGMPFAYVHKYSGLIEYTGAMDAIRRGTVYKAACYPTWGVCFHWKAYQRAREKEECGGFMWPTEEIARGIAKLFEKTGEKQHCWNLATLREKFPGHPVIGEVEQIVARKAAQDR